MARKRAQHQKQEESRCSGNDPSDWDPVATRSFAPTSQQQQAETGARQVEPASVGPLPEEDRTGSTEANNGAPRVCVCVLLYADTLRTDELLLSLH